MDQLIWRKSARSGGDGGDCVEVADNHPETVFVRDSKDRQGPTLTFTRVEWAAFVHATKTGAFDH